MNIKSLLDKKIANFFNTKHILVLVFAVVLLFAGSKYLIAQGGPGEFAGNFTFNGTIQNSTYTLVVNANISVWTMEMGPNSPETFLASNLTDDNGNFTLDVITPSAPQDYNGPFVIKIRVYDDDNNAIFSNPPLPPFPKQMLTDMLNGQIVYIVPASTIFITATNDTEYFANFSGMVSDGKFGAMFDMFMPPEEVFNRSVVVPQGRNYTVTIMKQYDPVLQMGTPPLTNIVYDNNLSDYSVFNLTFNISISNRYLTGNLSVIDENLDVVLDSIVIYVSAGGMFPLDMPPMSIMEPAMPGEDDNGKGFNGYVINASVLSAAANTSGYNVTLVGSSSGIEYVVGVFGKNGSQGADGTQYYSMWQNFTLSDSDVEFNISLQPLSGAYMEGSSGLPVNTTMINVSIVYNMSGTMTKAQQGGDGILTVKTHGGYGPVVLKAMAQPDNEGSFRFAIVAGSNVTVQLFNKQFAPRENVINLSATGGQNQIELKGFDLRAPGEGGSEISGGTFVGIFNNNESCNVPVPDMDGCQLMNFSHDPTTEGTRFNPIKMMMGNKVNVMIKPATGASLYMIEVDMMASGPPDAQTPTSADTDSSSGDDFSQLWKVGSLAPNAVFSYAYVGITYPGTMLTDGDVNVTLNHLYNNNWDLLWNISNTAYADSTAAINALPEEFQDFLPTYQCYFNSSGPCTCSLTDNTQLCYINKTEQRIYLKILHFTGDDPGITGDLNAGPNATVDSPVNASFYPETNISINLTIDDTADQCWFTNVTGENETIANCANTTSTTYFLAIENTLNNITVGANDTDNNINWTTIFFTVDTLYPAGIVIAGQTTANGSYTNMTGFEINASFTEANPSNCWVLNSTEDIQNLTMDIDTISYYCNLTVALETGDHNYSIAVNDSAGNINVSDILYFVIVDDDYPVFEDGYPNETIATIDITTNITFNITEQYFNESTLTMSNIIIAELDSGVQFNGSINISLENATRALITIDPYDPLGTNTTYVVNVTLGVVDLAGQSAEDYFTFNFTTNESYAPEVAQVIGNASFVDTNVNDLNITINGTDVYDDIYNSTLLVLFNNGTGGTIFEFNFTFAEATNLTLSNISFTRNPNESVGSLIVKNLDLMGGTKNVFIDNITGFDGVCLRDDESIDIIDQFSGNCTASGEVFVPCPGANASYTCDYVSAGERYKVTGLSYSAVIQMNDTIPPQVTSYSPTTTTTTTTTLTAITDTNATCRYSANSGTSFDSMSSSSQTSLGTSHGFSVSTASTGTYYHYIKCNDTYGNIAYDDYTATITATISSSTTTSTSGTSGSLTTVGKTVSWAVINPGDSVQQAIGDGTFPISQIAFKVKSGITQLSNVGITINTLADAPSEAAGVNITSKVYKYFKIEALNIAANKLDGSITLKLKVPRTWLSSNNISITDVVLKHYLSVDKKWAEYAATKVSEDSDYIYFEAATPSFSSFAIAQSDAAAALAATAVTETPATAAEQPEASTAGEQPSAGEAETTETVPEEKPKEKDLAWLWWALGVILVVLIAIVAFFAFRKPPIEASKHSLEGLKK